MLLRGIVISTLVFVSERAFAYECDKQLVYDATFKGEIKSPGYDSGAYPTELSCEYKIKAPDNYRIKITFKDMDIDPTDGCGTDKLVIMGKGQESTLGVFCGQLIPNPVISNENENEIEMAFQSDYLVGGRGFHLLYESAPGLELCGEEEGICRNRNCYHVGKRCDGNDDCGDGTDEEACDMPVAVPSDDDCGDPPITPSTIYGSPDRQVGGEAAVPNSWPWQVSLQRTGVEPNGHFCGGTLISPQWVVSAAHCVPGIQHPTNLRIVLGSHNKYNKTKYEITRVAERIISYPDLEGDDLRNANMRHDISLIKLNAPVAFNDGVQPACLPHLGWEAKAGWHCYSTGWGETRGSGFSDVLKQTVQVVQHKDNCTHDEETQICVDKTFNSPCHGDSGGPLVCKLGGKWFLMGATSFATSSNFMGGLCGMPESKVIFAKVADKGDWIRQVIDINS